MLNISYPFRKLLTITQSGNDLLPDHQVCLTIPYMFGMQSTFTDLCFEDVFGRHCPHWVESYESGVSAKVWVRAPLVGKNTQLFLKYGTPVVNLSNSDATFLLFDDFPGNSLNSDKWSEVSGSNITVQNSKLILNKTSSNVSGVRATNPVFANEVEFEIKYSTYTAVKYSFYFSLRNSLAGSSGVLVYHETTGDTKLWIMDTSGNYAQSNINTPPEGPLTFRIKRNTSSGAVRVYYDDSLILSKTVDSYRNSPIYLAMEYGDSADSATGTAEIDSIIARSSTDSTFELAEVQDSPERRVWYSGVSSGAVLSSSLVLIKPEVKELEAGFLLVSAVADLGSKSCTFTLIEPITESKTQAYALMSTKGIIKDCEFVIASSHLREDLTYSFCLLGGVSPKSKAAAFYLLKQVIYKPLEVRLIAPESASKTSGFSLAESLAVDEFGATVSFTEVASSCQPILVSAVTKNAGFAFGVPSVEVPELELFTSATEVPVSVVIHLHKASTKSARFAFEDAKWVILVNTSLKISPKALESNAAAILHKERAKASEFEIDEINPVQLNSVTINNSEVWTTALRFVVVPGLGSGGDVQKLSKKLSFAIEHDTPYDDTSEEYFSRINGYLHPYDFSPVKHKHDDFYPTKNEVVSTYALDTTKVIAGDTIVPADRGGSAFQLVVITSDNLASWQSGSRQLSWTFRWEHLGLGFGPIGLTSNVTKASYTLDLKTFMRLYLAIVQGNLAQASSDVQNIWATYFDQVAYFYKHGTLDGHPGGDYSATWNLTVWNSAGAANNAWNTPANRGYLYTSRWDPHRFDLFFYRKHPAYLVADYHVKLPAIGGKTPKVVTAVAFPGGEVPSSMDISTMVSSDYTGQSLMGRSIISRAHTGFSIRGINGDTVIVRSFGKPFYIVALITFDNTFDTIDEWDTSPDRFLKGTKEIKSSHTRIAASFSIKPWLVG